MLVSGDSCQCKPSGTCQCGQWVRIRSDAPRGFRAPLGALDDYAGQACLDVRNDKGNPASKPCVAYCGKADAASWSRLCNRLIRDARAACHRVGKCQRVEELAAFYSANVGLIGAAKWITHGRWIENVAAPVAQELACIVTEAANVGPHPDAPKPLPKPPPVGPGPSWIPGPSGSDWAILLAGLVAMYAFTRAAES